MAKKDNFEGVPEGSSNVSSPESIAVHTEQNRTKDYPGGKIIYRVPGNSVINNKEVSWGYALVIAEDGKKIPIPPKAVKAIYELATEDKEFKDFLAKVEGQKQSELLRGKELPTLN